MQSCIMLEDKSDGVGVCLFFLPLLLSLQTNPENLHHGTVLSQASEKTLCLPAYKSWRLLEDLQTLNIII